MYIPNFNRPDDLKISTDGDTVESGMLDVDKALDYMIKSLNTLAKMLDLRMGPGVVIVQDASTKAFTFEVKDYADLAKKSEMESGGRGVECTLLEEKDLNTSGITNGKYFVARCKNSPAPNDGYYFMETLAYQGHVWQTLYAFDTLMHAKLTRFKTSTAGWTSWVREDAFVPNYDAGGNIWMG